MTDETKKPKAAAAPKADAPKADDKQARLAEALRANLRRRKEQAKSRQS